MQIAIPIRALVMSVATLMAVSFASAADITTADIIAIPDNATGSGNGTLDVRLFTFAGGGNEIDNESGSVNVDNGNIEATQGGGTDNQNFAESFVTTAGKLQAYYDLNFGANAINEIVVLLDLNETGGGQPNNSLDLFDVVLNPATIQGNPDPVNEDVQSKDNQDPDQVSIDQVYTGGTVIAQLVPEPAANLPVNAQGAGFADYGIFTGIDPYSLNANDVLLFNVSMSVLNNGAEEIFLSGSLSGADIAFAVQTAAVPEPGSLALLAIGCAAALRRRRVAG